MTFVPTGARILVRPQKPEEKTAGGILLPEVAQEQELQGEVIATGPGRREGADLVPVEVEVGAQVLFSRYGGAPVKIEDEDLLILTEADILGEFK